LDPGEGNLEELGDLLGVEEFEVILLDSAHRWTCPGKMTDRLNIAATFLSK
jgi:hypothetical protein